MVSTELIGYADRLSVAPGQAIAFKVSTDLPDYQASIVRLLRGSGSESDLQAETVAPLPVQVGRKQTAYTGSYVRVEHHPALSPASLTIQMWIYPTMPEKGQVQGLLSKWAQDSGAPSYTGYTLTISETGNLALIIGDQLAVTHGDQVSVARIYSGVPLRARQWYFVAATFDAETGIVTLYQIPLSNWAREESSVTRQQMTTFEAVAQNSAPLLIAATSLGAAGRRNVAQGLYNGKIDSPRLFARALSPDEIERLRQNASPSEVGGDDLVAAWDFTADIPTSRIIDTECHQLHGKLINMPMRAVTGHTWNHSEFDFKRVSEQYGAIYFHDDDLEDAGWETNFEWRVPEGTKSGFYAAWLRSGDREDYIPFFVRPQRGTATAQAAVLVPTMTYLAYANERMKSFPIHAATITNRPVVKDPLDLYLADHPEFAMSIYDLHSDGSGCCYSSRLRPIVNMRPNYRMWLVGGARHLAADLNLTHWLETKGVGYDVFTDEDLHFDGQELLDHYKVILTGTHPEYWTAPMRAALEAYLASGGRLMYLGGNGFYWVIAVDPERPHMVEVRRGNGGTRAWNSAPGEQYHSATGEMGGLWRHRGKAPNALAGIGFGGMGWGSPTPGYVRQPGSFDERAAFIFEGVAPNEIIGDFGSILGGAAGDEIDRLDVELGSPPHALLLATATGYSRRYLPVIEDILELSTSLLEHQDPNVRADMVYFETPNDGAVFSSGSITWCGSLSHNNFNNNVSRITENVLRKFLSD